MRKPFFILSLCVVFSLLMVGSSGIWAQSPPSSEKVAQLQK